MPMPREEIVQLIKAALPDAEVSVQPLADDDDHYAATVSSKSFAGMTKVRQHQLVYEALQGRVGTTLHALQLITTVPK